VVAFLNKVNESSVKIQPENPFCVIFHSSAPRTRSKHKDEIARRRLVPPTGTEDQMFVAAAASKDHENVLTRYVSHIRMVFCTLISLINKQFIQRNANCINSTFCDSRCANNGAEGKKGLYEQTGACAQQQRSYRPSIRATNSAILLTLLCIPGCAKM
jgi:hypothetical protein